MLKFGNKEFRNLQEQVLANMRAIGALKTTGLVLDEFGIKVIGQADTVAEMPTVESYKEDNPEWAYGDAYAIGTTDPYTLYILTRANEAHPADFWFDIGEFPAVGPQGPQGPQGETGPQGQTGNPGADGLSAGFGSVTAIATTLTPGSDATVSVTASGPNTAKEFSFTFGIPEGEPGVAPELEWGNISGDLADQEDLVSALQAKQNKLVSGTNIKTINNESILGSGNIVIQGGGDVTDVEVNGVSVVDQDGVAEVTVPTKTSDLTNDSGFITSAYHDATKQDVISDLATIRSGAAAGATAVQPAAISDMATETWVGQQGYITGITSSDVVSALGYTPGTSNFSGAYADLTGKPTIPTKTSDLTNDSGFITSSALTGYATESYVQGYHDSTKQDVISDLSTIRSGAALGATAVQPAALTDYVTKAGGTEQSPETITGVKYFTDTLLVEYIQCPDTIKTATLEADEIVPGNTNYQIVLPDKSGTMALTSDIPTDYVTTGSAEQSISGKKTFSNLWANDFTSTSIALLDTSSQNGSKTTFTNIGQLTDNRTITLPNKSGTMALTSDIPSALNFVTLDTAQTITGSKTFSNGLEASEVATESLALYNSTTNFQFDISGTATADRTIVIPDKSGTLAMTSDIPSTLNFVTLDTAQTVTGNKTFGSVEMSDATIDDLTISNSYGGFTLYNSTAEFQFDISGTPTNDRTITLPDKSGTVAMTSDIPTVPTHISAFINDVGYLLPSAISNMVTTDGGTEQNPQVITGAKTFGTINATSVQASSLVYGLNVKCGSLLNSSNDVISLPSSAGTLALTSDIPTDTSDLTNGAGYITGITSGMVTTALGYTPLQSVTPTSETWTFTLSDGTTTTKTIVTAVTSA